MSRPVKCRKVCCLPRNTVFVPVTSDKDGQKPVCLTVDEYEAIRLIDKEDVSQEACSDYMKVARTTVQIIYNNARRKIAHALVNGLSLRIEGGEYQLCDGKEPFCNCGGCEKHRCQRTQEEIKNGRTYSCKLRLLTKTARCLATSDIRSSSKSMKS